MARQDPEAELDLELEDLFSTGIEADDIYEEPLRLRRMANRRGPDFAKGRFGRKTGMDEKEVYSIAFSVTAPAVNAKNIRHEPGV